MGPTGAPVPLTGRSPSCARPDACLLCWRPDRHGQVEKVTGLRGARGGVALWKANRVRSSRCGLTGPESRRADDERPGGRWGAGRRVSEWRSSSLSPDTFPGDDLRPPGTAVTYRELDLKEKKEVVEEAENGRDAPANGNANEENGEQEADNEVDEEEEEGGEEEEEEEEGDGEEEDGDEDEEAEAATGKRAAEDDEDDDVDTKKQKTDEDD
ncbi:prothymosin alpha isoform X1 [Zalophus californianus]|uniref:Prothymosin alpha n=1 Tax=Zalophus californianus TaxID=9704 RepID=A0A6P9F9C2_ZALCA|nr:prothymosin alpha isoform X1 [Zalophus californianus]